MRDRVIMSLSTSILRLWLKEIWVQPGISLSVKASKLRVRELADRVWDGFRPLSKIKFGSPTHICHTLIETLDIKMIVPATVVWICLQGCTT